MCGENLRRRSLCQYFDYTTVKLLNVITFQTSHIIKDYLIKITGSGYHSVSKITVGLAQSGNIKRRLLYFDKKKVK